MDQLPLFKHRKWQRQRQDDDAYLADLNPMVLKINEIITSGTGGGAAEKNKVILNADLPEVPGIQYQSYADAIAYILTQTYDATHLWVIQFTGVISENITAYEFIEVVGSGTTSSWIDGDVDCVSDGGLFGVVISNCIIANLHVTSAGTMDGNIKNCVIIDCTTSAGAHAFLFDKCYLVKGDYTHFDNPSIINSTISSIFGVISLSDPEVHYCYIKAAPGKDINIDDGSFEDCNISLTDLIMTGTINYESCQINKDYTIAATADFNMEDCVIEADILVDGTLGTRRCSLKGSITEGTGTWDNGGELYDNRLSGLTALNMQEVGDELASIKANKAVGVNGSFIVGAQTFTITDGIITSIV